MASGVKFVPASSDKWYFTKEQIRNNPTCRIGGWEPDVELCHRQNAANFIQEIGQRMQVTQLCINTAIVYMHRFYMFHPFTVFHRTVVSTSALFLAAKVEEQPRKLEHLVKAVYSKNNPPPEKRAEVFAEHASEIIVIENIMIQTLGFELAIDHPHTYIVKTCALIQASKDLSQTSYFMASNSLHLTMMCLQYKPTVVACFCIHLACKWANWEIPPSNEGKMWFHYVDSSVTGELLEELTKEFLLIFDKSPSRLKKRITMLQFNNTKNPNTGAIYDNLTAYPFDADARNRKLRAERSEHESKHKTHAKAELPEFNTKKVAESEIFPKQKPPDLGEMNNSKKSVPHETNVKIKDESHEHNLGKIFKLEFLDYNSTRNKRESSLENSHRNRAESHEHGVKIKQESHDTSSHGKKSYDSFQGIFLIKNKESHDGIKPTEHHRHATKPTSSKHAATSSHATTSHATTSHATTAHATTAHATTTTSTSNLFSSHNQTTNGPTHKVHPQQKLIPPTVKVDPNSKTYTLQYGQKLSNSAQMPQVIPPKLNEESRVEIKTEPKVAATAQRPITHHSATSHPKMYLFASDHEGIISDVVKEVTMQQANRGSHDSSLLKPVVVGERRPLPPKNAVPRSPPAQADVKIENSGEYFFADEKYKFSSIFSPMGDEGDDFDSNSKNADSTSPSSYDEEKSLFDGSDVKVLINKLDESIAIDNDKSNRERANQSKNNNNNNLESHATNAIQKFAAKLPANVSIFDPIDDFAASGDGDEEKVIDMRDSVSSMLTNHSNISAQSQSPVAIAPPNEAHTHNHHHHHSSKKKKHKEHKEHKKHKEHKHKKQKKHKEDKHHHRKHKSEHIEGDESGEHRDGVAETPICVPVYEDTPSVIPKLTIKNLGQIMKQPEHRFDEQAAGGSDLKIKIPKDAMRASKSRKRSRESVDEHEQASHRSHHSKRAKKAKEILDL